MTEQFSNQGGAATSNPGRLMRWTVSRLMTRVGSERRLEKQRAKAEQRRIAAGGPHVVEYFHQVEDGYSHLAAQLLAALLQRYDIELVCHLVRGPAGKNVAEPDLLLQLSRTDSALVAPEYGLDVPPRKDPPDPALLERAGRILAAQDTAGFVEYAADVGAALWRDDGVRLDTLAAEAGCADSAALQSALDSGTARRKDLGHYSGAMFHYGGEWYWGVDRLYHLEHRLADLGADLNPGAALLVPRPEVEAGPLRDDGSLTLEVFPSLRSPYTSISFDRALRLAQETGVALSVRPVLPMVMRGVPATRQKGMYIFWDTAREARAAGVPYGRFYDPIGEPVRRAYSLYPWACEQGKGNALISAFLRCAFVEGVNTNTTRGLKKVVQQAGLDWGEARVRIGTPGWEALLETHRLAMYDAGLWGVPSFRLLDEGGREILALWGQDRLWLVARVIQRQLSQRTTG